MSINSCPRKNTFVFFFLILKQQPWFLNLFFIQCHIKKNLHIQSGAHNRQHHNPLLTRRSSSPSNPSALGVLGVGGCPSQRLAAIGRVAVVGASDLRRGQGGGRRGGGGLGPSPCWLVREALELSHTHAHTHIQVIHTSIVCELWDTHL